MDELIYLDQQLLLDLNGSDSLLLDTFFMTVTRTATWIPMFVVLLYIVWQRSKASPTPAPPTQATPSQATPTSEARPSSLRGSGERFQERVFFLLFLLSLALVILLADRVSSGLCKPFFHRLRPSHEPALEGLVDIVGDYRGGLYGFISSHAANTFGVATFVALALRHRATTLTLFAWALLFSYSRIYLGLHYPGDILAGALWGVLSALLVYSLTMSTKVASISPSFRSAVMNFQANNSGQSIHSAKNLSLLLPLTFLLTILVTLLISLFTIGN